MFIKPGTYDEPNGMLLMKRGKVIANSGRISWQPMGPTGTPPPHDGASTTTAGNGRISSLYFRDGGAIYTIYAGGNTGGLWRRNSNSSTWTNLGANLPNLKVSTIAINPISALHI